LEYGDTRGRGGDTDIFPLFVFLCTDSFLAQIRDYGIEKPESAEKLKVNDFKIMKSLNFGFLNPRNGVFLQPNLACSHVF
jgi:hypothetical protein